MDDLISRKWLMECVNEGWIKFDTEKDKNTYVHLVRDIAPSAEPLTAYVISDEDGNIKCSNCGGLECWGNYCMNCGAKMRGENNG